MYARLRSSAKAGLFVQGASARLEVFVKFDKIRCFWLSWCLGLSECGFFDQVLRKTRKSLSLLGLNGPTQSCALIPSLNTSSKGALLVIGVSSQFKFHKT